MTRWHILGAGSMGCLWAALLRSAGHPVALLLKDRAAAETYRQSSGIRVERDGSVLPIDCTAEVAALLSDWDPLQQPTALIVATKAYATVAALGAIRLHLPKYRAIILMQNGMGTLQEVEETFPGLPLYVGVTAQGAYRRAPFHIVHAGQGKTWIGREGDGRSWLTRDRVEPLLALDAEVFWDEQILPRMWTKLAINCVINGLTVLFGCPNGEIAEARHRPRVVALCAEIEQVMTASLPPALDLDLVRRVVEVAEATRTNYSSMLQDVQHGRRTEIDYINGYLCRTAARLNIGIPENSELLRQLLAVAGSP